MWSELRKTLERFPTVVLSWVDDGGYPVSARTTLQPDDSAETLRFTAPVGLGLRVGPASILGHSHDEATWRLTEFLTRGRLEHDATGWTFRPTAYIPGQGVSGPLEEVKAALRYRPTAKRYLERRGLSRPVIPWDKIKSTH